MVYRKSLILVDLANRAINQSAFSAVSRICAPTSSPEDRTMNKINIFNYLTSPSSYPFILSAALTICLTTVSHATPEHSLRQFEIKDLQGSFTQGGMLRGKVPSGTEVKLNDQPIRVSPDGHFVFGFGREAELNHSLELNLGDTQKKLPIKLAKRDYKIQRIEGIPKKIMSPDESSLKRIRLESSQVASARKTDSDRLDFIGEALLPVKGPITGVYGSQRFYNGEPSRPHYGLDLAAPTGTPVLAPLSGVVTLTHDDMFYSGGTLIMDHGYGISSTFIHLSKILVAEGEEVKAGEVIAEVGASGRATGPHLDWRINWYNVRLDPALLLP